MSVYVRNDDNGFEYGRSEQLQGKIFGVKKDDNLAGSLFLEWCGEHGFTPVLQEFASLESLNAVLKSKKK